MLESQKRAFAKYRQTEKGKEAEKRYYLKVKEKVKKYNHERYLRKKKEERI